MSTPYSPEASETIQSRLRACPHCGPMPAMPELVRSDVNRRWQVFCGPCGSSSGSCKTPQEAARLWNSRHVGATEMGSSSAAATELAVWLSNSLTDLSPSDAPPRYGFSTNERGERAYALAEAIIGHVNDRLLAGHRTDAVADG